MNDYKNKTGELDECLTGPRVHLAEKEPAAVKGSFQPPRIGLEYRVDAEELSEGCCPNWFGEDRRRG